MEDIKFNVETDKYPEILFEGNSDKDIINFILSNGIVFNSTSLTAERKLSDLEIESLRGNYIELIEDVEPILTDELYKKTEEQKQIVNEAKEKLQSCRTQIHDYVSQVKRGVVDYELGSDNTYRIAIDGKYLYYANIDNRLVLAKISTMPDNDDANLFDAQDANGLAFEKLR